MCLFGFFCCICRQKSALFIIICYQGWAGGGEDVSHKLRYPLLPNFPPLVCVCVRARACVLLCSEFLTPLFSNLRDKVCNISTISKIDACRIKVRKKKRGGKEEEGKKGAGGGTKRMDIVSSTGSGRARIFIVTSLNRSKVSLSLHNERLC